MTLVNVQFKNRTKYQDSITIWCIYTKKIYDDFMS